MEAESGGLFLQVLQTAGECGGGDFEGFGFVVGLVAFDHAVDDARELVRRGDDAFGLAAPRLEPPATEPRDGGEMDSPQGWGAAPNAQKYHPPASICPTPRDKNGGMTPLFPIGQKVVCIGDRFTSAVFEAFDQVPQAGHIYTISAIAWMEEHGSGQQTLAITLAELPSLEPNWGAFALRRFRLLEDDAQLRAAASHRTAPPRCDTTLHAA